MFCFDLRSVLWRAPISAPGHVIGEQKAHSGCYIAPNFFQKQSLKSRILTVTQKDMKYPHKFMTYFCVPQKDVKQKNLSAYLIGEYRVLWLRLSQLVSETGKMHEEILFPT
jgi:hypothetical protein